MARICLVPTSNTIEGNLAQVERYRDSIDLVELRVDLLEPAERPKALRFPGLCSFPTICTVRRDSDGGAFAEGEPERSQLLTRLASARFAFVDLESDSQMVDVERAFKTSGARIIRSHHDLDGTPSDIAALYRHLSARADEIPKIAVTPRSLSDAIRLFETARSLPDRERILLSMGSRGFLTRVLAEKMGSMLTFASPSGSEAAPGHIDPESLESTYRFRSIQRTTRCIAVVGDPVMHSRSPTIHNAGIEIIGSDIVYIPLHASTCDTIFESWDLLELDGISVTVPHKQSVIELLDVVDESVRRIGSCNTVVRRNGRFEGTNTDALGLLTAIQTLMPGGTLPKSALIVGAGGTARAAAYVLTEAGVDLLIVNRTIERAVSLAEEFGCRAAALDESSTRLIRDHSSLIIQSTSAGMHPNEHLDPLDFYEFSGEEALLDVIYAPPQTKILKRAERAGCTIMNGWEMLLKQAHLQFEIFTSVPYPDGAVVAGP